MDGEASQSGVAFDLGSIERDLRHSEPYLREGHTARTLLHAADMRVVVIAIKGGNRIPAHQANESATIHAISGHLRLHVGARVAELPPGHLLILARGIGHDVEASIDSAFVLTLGWPPT